MANCRADLNLFHEVVDLNDRESIRGMMVNILKSDNDLWENGDEYFKYGEKGPLCYELGYEDDAEMIVGEAMKRKRLNSLASFERVFTEAMRGLTDQEYWGDYEMSFEDLGNGKISVAFAVGGYNQW